MKIFLYKGLTRNLKSEIPLFEFCPISGDWGKLKIQNLPGMSLMKTYLMLQNVNSDLLRENQQGVKISPLIKVNICSNLRDFKER